jgi:hypothetical protein
LHAKDFGNISDSQAELQANVYRYLGLNFEESLNLYARYVNGEVGIPAPTPEAVKEWYGQFKTDTERAAAADWARGPVAAARTGLPPGAEQTDVGQAILAVTSDPTVQAAMWHGTSGEGGQTGPWGTGPGGPSVGDSGNAVGPWQINFGPANDPNQDGVRERRDGTSISREQAADPATAAQWMLSEYEYAVSTVPPELWQSDPGGALRLAQANAERPEGWHEGLTVEEAVAIYGGRVETGPIAAVGPRGLPGGLPAVPGALELTTEERGFNQAQAKALPLEDLLQYKQETGLSGRTLVESLYALYHNANPGRYPLTSEESTIAEYRAQHPKAEAWTDDDWRYVIANELGLEDIQAAEAAGQTPQAYVAKSVQEFDAFLKKNKLTLQEFQEAEKWISDAEMQDAIGQGINLREYIQARQAGLSYADIQKGHLEGKTPVETLIEVKAQQRQAEVEQAQQKLKAEAAEAMRLFEEAETGKARRMAAASGAPPGQPGRVWRGGGMGSTWFLPGQMPSSEEYALLSSVVGANLARFGRIFGPGVYQTPGGVQAAVERMSPAELAHELTTSDGGAIGLPRPRWAVGPEVGLYTKHWDFNAAMRAERKKARGEPLTPEETALVAEAEWRQKYYQSQEEQKKLPLTPKEQAQQIERGFAENPAYPMSPERRAGLLATTPAPGQPGTAAARGQGAIPAVPAAPLPAGTPTQRLGRSGWGYNTATGQWEYLGMPAAPTTTTPATAVARTAIPQGAQVPGKVNPVTPEPVAARWKYNPATGRWEVPTRAVTPEKVNRVTPEPATVATPAAIDWTKWKPWAQTAAAAATPQPATAEARAYGGLAMMRRGTSKKAPAAAGFRKGKKGGLTGL